MDSDLPAIGGSLDGIGESDPAEGGGSFQQIRKNMSTKRFPTAHLHLLGIDAGCRPILLRFAAHLLLAAFLAKIEFADLLLDLGEHLAAPSVFLCHFPDIDRRESAVFPNRPRRNLKLVSET